jgi:hypothetical protein
MGGTRWRKRRPVQGLTTLPPSCADCLKIWEPQPRGNFRVFYWEMVFPKCRFILSCAPLCWWCSTGHLARQKRCYVSSLQLLLLRGAKWSKCAGSQLCLLCDCVISSYEHRAFPALLEAVALLRLGLCPSPKIKKNTTFRKPTLLLSSDKEPGGPFRSNCSRSLCTTETLNYLKYAPENGSSPRV